LTYPKIQHTFADLNKTANINEALKDISNKPRPNYPLKLIKTAVFTE